jgi:hypothetical protein
MFFKCSGVCVWGFLWGFCCGVKGVWGLWLGVGWFAQGTRVLKKIRLGDGVGEIRRCWPEEGQPGPGVFGVGLWGFQGAQWPGWLGRPVSETDLIRWGSAKARVLGN